MIDSKFDQLYISPTNRQNLIPEKTCDIITPVILVSGCAFGYLSLFLKPQKNCDTHFISAILAKL